MQRSSTSSLSKSCALIADEQFDVDEEELERTLSLGTAEKLRDAGIPAMESLLEAPEAYVSPSEHSLHHDGQI